jgi:transposase
MRWLRTLRLTGVYQEILDEYLLTYDKLDEALTRLDKRIEELAQGERYLEPVQKLRCFIGIETHTALSLVSEISDFNRFPSAEKFASFLGLVPGEHTSSDSRNTLSITKAGNSHLRRLLTESAHSFGRGKIGYKSQKLKKRQEGNSPEVIRYADKANERLRRRFYKMKFGGKKYNVASTAIARELACFVWGMMTNHISTTA